MHASVSSRLDDDEALSSALVGVSVTLPDNVVFLENPQVAHWDASGIVNHFYNTKWIKNCTHVIMVTDLGKQWRMDGITNVSYSKEEAKISFKMDSFRPFVLIQDTYANFPFQSWELRPLGQDSALFTINGAFLNLSITIKV